MSQPLPDMRPTQLPGMREGGAGGFPEEAAAGWVDWDVWKEHVAWRPDLTGTQFAAPTGGEFAE